MSFTFSFLQQPQHHAMLVNLVRPGRLSLSQPAAAAAGSSTGGHTAEALNCRVVVGIKQGQTVFTLLPNQC